LKFKVVENLPTEYASILRGSGFADTVSDENLSGASDSVLSEAGLGFRECSSIPPKSHPGIVVFRPETNDTRREANESSSPALALPVAVEDQRDGPNL
jgi:hypothetical protein